MGDLDFYSLPKKLQSFNSKVRDSWVAAMRTHPKSGHFLTLAWIGSEHHVFFNINRIVALKRFKTLIVDGFFTSLKQTTKVTLIQISLIVAVLRNMFNTSLKLDRQGARIFYPKNSIYSNIYLHENPLNYPTCK